VSESSASGGTQSGQSCSQSFSFFILYSITYYLIIYYGSVNNFHLSKFKHGGRPVAADLRW
jgi:hypothetical protein